MLTGKELGQAIAEAIRLKGVKNADVARHFGVKPPSVSDWISRGTIDKAKLDALFEYFHDVVGPDHWGRTPAAVDRWPMRVEEKLPAAYHARPLVQQVCDVAETIDDAGLRDLLGIARCLAGSHPLAKAKRA